MTVRYTITRDALKKKNYKAGSRSEKGTRPANADYTILRPILIKIENSNKNDL